MICEQRIRRMNGNQLRHGKYILYWMQSSQRAEYNHALEYSIHQANKTHKSVLVYFGLTNKFPEANERHYFFMLEGLRGVKKALADRGMQMVIMQESPEIGAIRLAKEASMLVVDRGYLKIEKKWREQVATSISCPLIQIESNTIVPVEEASAKEEYSAATFRPKIMKKLSSYLVPFSKNVLERQSLQLNYDSIDIENIENALVNLKINSKVQRVRDFSGGTSNAKKCLHFFLKHNLDQYNVLRNDPTKDTLSKMSPFLHFGQISPLYIALKVIATNSPGKEAYLEELIIRRELAINFVCYNRDYDLYDSLPEWAKKTLAKHSKDTRPFIYSLSELENGETHDKYWNAAQREMINKGKMHGYMRMYWGKKIIEWNKKPQDAFKIALYLNNKYELDGRDPNGYAGIAWCFGKHDRPWKERKIFGMVRYMNEKGLKRKFNADKYASYRLETFTNQ